MEKMRILIITPAPKRTRTGNRITALRWARLLKKLGHAVAIETEFNSRRCDLLIALHARKSHAALTGFRKQNPGKPIILALTGTDVYQDIQTYATARESLELADWLVLLQPKAIEELPFHLHGKCRVIYQSSARLNGQARKRSRTFDICVIGHLRKVKDPFRAAYAVRDLPAASRLRVIQVGAALELEMEQLALAEMRRNSRYCWLGEKPRWQTRQIMARSQLLVLSSKLEGGANVISEAIMASVPVISSRISGSVGMLGEDHPGYFPFADTQALRSILLKAETNPVFLSHLQEWCERLVPSFEPDAELEAWLRLLGSACNQ
jgi:putative glycosyltransferase (TIGR04348 family)